ncbi:HAD family hydrolase [Paenibacillus chartarius]|uniref:HAD family hydrolase n=1 Tax=Paenibacillus chartarius TaxID=747481 RepID=A0ABV6DK17_9BACL
MLKLIIFDLDGTIGNTLPLCIAAFKRSIEPLAGRSLSNQEIIDTFGPSEEGTVNALIPDKYEQGIAAYLDHYRELHGMCAEPFDGIVDILDFAKNNEIRLAMVTGKGEHSTKITLEVFGIEAYFDAIETGSPYGPRKVNGIRSVVEQLGVLPSESVYIGDAPSDILASREVGVPVLSAAWAETAELEQLKSLKPDRIFTSVEELKKYVQQACAKP